MGKQGRQGGGSGAGGKGKEKEGRGEEGKEDPRVKKSRKPTSTQELCGPGWLSRQRLESGDS